MEIGGQGLQIGLLGSVVLEIDFVGDWRLVLLECWLMNWLLTCCIILLYELVVENIWIFWWEIVIGMYELVAGNIWIGMYEFIPESIWIGLYELVAENISFVLYELVAENISFDCWKIVKSWNVWIGCWKYMNWNVWIYWCPKVRCVYYVFLDQVSLLKIYFLNFFHSWTQ